MKTQGREKVRKVNCLSNDMNSLYHQAARKLGMADSVLIVLYAVYEKDGRCRLCDICTENGISKQTVNSAIRKLEEERVLYLERDGAKTKRVCLTEKGKAYAERTVARLYEAECNVFEAWDKDEFEQYLRLMEKYNFSLRAEIEKMERGTSD